MSSPVYKRLWYRALAWTITLGYMGTIFFLSSRPSMPLPMLFPFQDKFYHFGEYFLLGFLLSHAVSEGSHKRRFWIAFVLASVYGMSDELHQYFVPGRDASVGDWLADTVGAWLGAYLYLKSESSMRRARS